MLTDSDWFAHPTVVIVEPGGRHWEILRPLLHTVQARGPRVADAHLAAVAPRTRRHLVHH